MNRRDFLKTSALATGALCLNIPATAQGKFFPGEARVKIGILSDIHVTDAESTEIFRHALEYYRDQKVDGVIIAGDMADWGRESQLKLVADAWFSVFPKDKRPDGEHVERLFIYGNHDVDGYTWHDFPKEEAIGPRKEKLWKKYFKEEYKHVWLKAVKGYYFVGSHWHSQENAPDVPPFLKAHEALLRGDKPFFYIQHAHPKNTTYGEWAWGQDNGEITETLSSYPNAIAFSGHSHMPLNDERCLWQGAFTSIGTSSLRYLYFLGGRENSKVDGSKERIPSQMKPSMESVGDGHQGMLMTICDNCIRIERHEFLHDENINSDWVIPKGKPLAMSWEERANTAIVPQFAKNDKVNVIRQDGKDRYDIDVKQCVVSFPTVLAKRTGVRANDYEVQVEYQFVDNTFITNTKRVYSPGCYLGENHDEESVICPYAENELPDYHKFRFVVRPCDSFGNKGEAIYSEWMKK